MQAMESEKDVWDPAVIQLVGTFFSPLQSLHQVVNNCELPRLYHHTDPHQLHCNNSVAYSKIREDNGGRGPVSGGVEHALLCVPTAYDLPCFLTCCASLVRDGNLAARCKRAENLPTEDAIVCARSAL